MGQLYASVLRKVPSLRRLSAEGLGKTGVALVCEACQWRGSAEGVEAGAAPLDLQIHSAAFTLQGFQQLAALLQTSPALRALGLPEHEHLTPAAVRALADGLAVNCSLQALDLHVTEMGQRGVRQGGVEAIVTALEANPASKLCKLDVSGDRGEPEVGRKLQKRLTKCLVRNSKQNMARRFLRYARLPVYSCHENE